MKTKLTRQEKAQQLFDAGTRPIKTADGWMVPGSNGTSYEVREELDGEWLCSCPDFQFRGYGSASTDLCKHIHLVLLVRQETTAQTTTCQACDRASNINSPYLWCSRDKSHYPHNREACKAFVDRAIPMIDHDIHLKPGRVVV